MHKDQKVNTANGAIYRNCRGETVLLRGHTTVVLETKAERNNRIRIENKPEDNGCPECGCLTMTDHPYSNGKYCLECEYGS